MVLHSNEGLDGFDECVDVKWTWMSRMVLSIADSRVKLGIVGNEGSISDLVGIVGVSREGGTIATGRRRSLGLAGLANMLINLRLHRCHGLLEVFQRNRGVPAIIRCCSARITGRISTSILARFATGRITGSDV
jgi:hypothetical protein